MARNIRIVKKTGMILLGSAIFLGVALAWISPAQAIEAARITGTVVDIQGKPVGNVLLRFLPVTGSPAPPLETKVSKKGKFTYPNVPRGIYYPKFDDPTLAIREVSVEAREPGGLKAGDFTNKVESGAAAPPMETIPLMRYKYWIVVERIEVQEFHDESALRKAQGDSPLLQELNDLFELEEWDSLLDRSEAVLAERPDLGGALYLRGIALWRTGDISAAIGMIRKAADILEDQPGIQGTLATLMLEHGRELQEAGENEKAKETFREAAELFRLQLDEVPDSIVYLTNLVVALDSMGDIPGTLEVLDDLIELAPDNPQPYMRKAELLVDNGRPEEAVEILKTLPGGGENASIVVFNAALEMWNQKRTEATLLALEVALELNPDLAEAYQLRGRALISQGETEAGLEALKRYLSMVPEDDPEAETDRKLVEALANVE